MADRYCKSRRWCYTYHKAVRIDRKRARRASRPDLLPD